LLTVIHVCESLLLITTRTIFCGRLHARTLTHTADSVW